MILVFVEHDTGQPSPASLEALAFARPLAGDRGEPLTAFLAGPGAADAAAHLGAHEVARALVAEGAAFEGYAAAAWGRALVGVATAQRCHLALAAGTDRGHEVLAHAAAMAGRPLAANCVTIAPESTFGLTRERSGGSLLEDAVIATPLLFATVAEHAATPVTNASQEAVVIERITPEPPAGDLRAHVVAHVPEEPGTISLADARVVVGGGRGMGSPEAFAALDELAALLGGAVGVSRAVTSSGWRPHREQVGQTGVRIAPSLYIACGISGAIQHMVGCRGAKALLAINTDREAEIMRKADYAVIGDVNTVVPAIVARIRQVRAASGSE